MTNEKHTYYVCLARGQIMRTKDDSTWEYEIQATDEEIVRLREIFDSNYSSDWQGFFRAHVPYLQYHYDRENDANDANMYRIYEILHELGTPDAKKFIEEQGFLQHKPESLEHDPNQEETT
ncbi:hydrolase [Mangrovibacillus cuniculi]|uniref:Hydrolase n=1 Tax=Mangrovibacillus cuniculi TaxID=2593652 RepID=A0A7S8CCB4_9BACI|nr:hydrolase [Mangrovibacillus cuniculi]QPC47307.1 hydrolase [Mangrovibacillus cuniculi]